MTPLGQALWWADQYGILSIEGYKELLVSWGRGVESEWDLEKALLILLIVQGLERKHYFVAIGYPLVLWKATHLTLKAMASILTSIIFSSLTQWFSVTSFLACKEDRWNKLKGEAGEKKMRRKGEWTESCQPFAWPWTSCSALHSSVALLPWVHLPLSFLVWHCTCRFTLT